jgi:peptidoglycan hydrolase-like protein with peptidoglycan-binding domain
MRSRTLLVAPVVLAVAGCASMGLGPRREPAPASAAVVQPRHVESGRAADQGREAGQDEPVQPAALSHERAVSTKSVVQEVQSLLGAAGYDAGQADGRMGAKTRAAIIRYQQEHGLPIDGTPSFQLLEHLKNTST